MSTAQIQSPDRAVQACQLFLEDLLSRYQPRDFAVRFWDGTTWEADPGQPTRYTLVLQHPGALRRFLWPPNRITLCEAYIFDDIDIEGDIEGFWRFVKYLGDLRHNTDRRRDRWRLGWKLFRLPSQRKPRPEKYAAALRGVTHSPDRDRQAISHHYDVSNDFFQLFLDRKVVYSCAYFESPDDDIDTAQERKLDYLCRKLHLRPGERLLDIGCGWGGLLMHAVQQYGVEAVGITISTAQAELVNARIRAAGLAHRCRVEVCDYRSLKDPAGFDKLVSIEMFEHVGVKQLPLSFMKAHELLRPGGLFLNQASPISAHTPIPRGPLFVHRYVFPDGELVPIHKTLACAEEVGFEVRDVESLREHFIHTLHHWVRRLEERADEARRLTDDVRYRIWRLYMSGSAFGFKIAWLNLYQTLFAKPDEGDSRLPLTRSDWYA